MTSIQPHAARNRTRRGVVLALVAAVAVLVGTVLITQLLSAGARRGPVRELARLKPQRPFAPRLSIPIAYHRCERVPPPGSEAVPREECGTSDEDSPDLADLAAGGESSDPDSLQAAALAAVIWADETDEQAMDAAIDHLSKALRLTLNRVPLLVDLSAAHLVRAERTQNPQDPFAALEFALQALEEEPRNRAALFNAALAMQAIGLDGKAAEAWDAYLVVDRHSHWAKEALRRKAKLITEFARPRAPAAGAPSAEVQAFATRYPQEARKLGWGLVLDEWGKAVEKGDTARAVLHLNLAEDLGRTLERRGGDASLMDAVQAIHAVRGNREATMRLAQGHRAYAAAEALLGLVKAEEAQDTLAHVTPARTLSPVLAQWADLSLVRTLLYLRKGNAAEAAFLRLLMEVDSVRDPVLAGRVRLISGTRLARGGQNVRGREQLRLAAEHFRMTGETEFASAAESTEGETAYEQGDTVGAYQLLQRAQRALRPYRQSTIAHNHLHGLARCVGLSGMPRAALAIYDEDVRIVKGEGTPVKVVDALQARARARILVGDSAGATADVDTAAAWAEALRGKEAQQEWAVAAIRTARPSHVSPAEMDSAVGVFAQNVAWLVPALLWRADAKLAADDVTGATADLEAVISGVKELSRQSNQAAVLRAAALEQARSRFDKLVMLYLRQERYEDALRTLERGRVSFAPRQEGGSPPGDARPSAPHGQVALNYALISDTLLAWVISGDSIHFVRQPVDRDSFLLVVEQTGAAMESRVREAAARPGLRRLYNWLIRPVQNHLGPKETQLVIVADGEVAGVPFAALLDARDQHLLEDHSVRYATTLADAFRPAAAVTGPPGPVLLVADPAFDRSFHLRLDRLRGARTEVDALMGLFPAAMRLDSVYATRDTFVARARTASLIHYAGHAVFDDARPERSYLVLAGADTTGRLTAEAVSEMRLGGVRLVVLSACRTLRARGGRSGGFAGLSGALLSAGAGGVVGSLWQVNDGRAQPLMVAFHRAYQRLPDPARALREAQLEMLRSDDLAQNSLATWAGFRYAGN